jgi:hypothetical protein
MAVMFDEKRGWIEDVRGIESEDFDAVDAVKAIATIGVIDDCKTDLANRILLSLRQKFKAGIDTLGKGLDKSHPIFQAIDNLTRQLETEIQHEIGDEITVVGAKVASGGDQSCKYVSPLFPEEILELAGNGFVNEGLHYDKAQLLADMTFERFLQDKSKDLQGTLKDQYLSLLESIYRFYIGWIVSPLARLVIRQLSPLGGANKKHTNPIGPETKKDKLEEYIRDVAKDIIKIHDKRTTEYKLLTIAVNDVRRIGNEIIQSLQDDPTLFNELVDRKINELKAKSPDLSFNDSEATQDTAESLDSLGKLAVEFKNQSEYKDYFVRRLDVFLDVILKPFSHLLLNDEAMQNLIKETAHPHNFICYLLKTQNTERSGHEILVPMTYKSKHSQIQGVKVNDADSSSEINIRLPDFVDLSYWFTSVKDQQLNSCTAYAAAALLEFLNAHKNNRARGQHEGLSTELSALFLYRMALAIEILDEHQESVQQEAFETLAQESRDIADNGTSIRNAMRALIRFGAPPVKGYILPSISQDSPQDQTAKQQLLEAFKLNPPPECYLQVNDYQDIKYFRLDKESQERKVLLAQIKAVLASGLPCIFAVKPFESLADESLTVSGNDGLIPFPDPQNINDAGHALVAVGYDDHRGKQGALLVRNSWGPSWGQGGYGWLPYEYVLYNEEKEPLLVDCWTLLDWEWVKQTNFGIAPEGWRASIGPDLIRG